MSDEELQAYLDHNTATVGRILAELIVLRRFLAQLYANCSPTPLDRVQVYDLMGKAMDQLEQRFLEKLESQSPQDAARIDQWRASVPESAENVMPPVW